jgi:hypothetical protein
MYEKKFILQLNLKMLKMGLSLYITFAAILNVALGITINEPQLNDF